MFSLVHGTNNFLPVKHGFLKPPAIQKTYQRRPSHSYLQPNTEQSLPSSSILNQTNKTLYNSNLPLANPTGYVRTLSYYYSTSATHSERSTEQKHAVNLAHVTKLLLTWPKLIARRAALRSHAQNLFRVPRGVLFSLQQSLLIIYLLIGFGLYHSTKSSPKYQTKLK